MNQITHVMVGWPTNCQKCQGTGEQPLGFMRLPNGNAVCEACNGAKMTSAFLTLQEFARLFTWGTVHDLDLSQPPRHVLMPAEPLMVPDTTSDRPLGSAKGESK